MDTISCQHGLRRKGFTVGIGQIDQEHMVTPRYLSYETIIKQVTAPLVGGEPLLGNWRQRHEMDLCPIPPSPTHQIGQASGETPGLDTRLGFALSLKDALALAQSVQQSPLSSLIEEQ
jgi:hypothetical protein